MRQKTRTGVEKAMSRILDRAGYVMTKFERRNLAKTAVLHAESNTVASWSRQERAEAQEYANKLRKKALLQVRPAYNRFGKQAEYRRERPLFTEHGDPI